MKKIILLVIIIIIIAIISAVLISREIKENKISKPNISNSTINSLNNNFSNTNISINTQSPYTTQTNKEGEVTIEVTPKKIGTGEKNIFEISFNTHSVNLDFNFTKIIVLEDNLGNKYQAMEWTGSNSGHHLNGDIIFPKINEQAKSINLIIKEIEGMEKTFSWNL